MTEVVERPRTAGPSSGLGGNWRVIVLNDDHNTFDHVAQTLARTIPGVTGSARHPAGAVSVVSVGTVVSLFSRMSMSTSSVRHAEALPARSTIRVASVCAPSPVTVACEAAGPDCTTPPSIRHSTWLMPECGSLPVTETVYGLATGPDGDVVVLVGATESIRTDSERHSEALPATSTERVSSVCVPVPETVACSGEAPDVTGPASTRHSTRARPEPSSAPDTITA
jgi:hypothetical protein